MSSDQLNSTLIEGHQMSLATLWRLLEEQRRNNGSSSIVTGKRIKISRMFSRL